MQNQPEVCISVALGSDETSMSSHLRENHETCVHN